jgi:two-component system, OmpR family, sensor histidine kinase KdpD
VPKTPEQWLQVASPAAKTRGSLKVFLGYAPGVGKTFTMLSEAIRRHSRGENVVVGVVETHGRKAICELSSQLEAVPRKKIEYKGTPFEEMDLEEILRRKPHVVVVDELAHTNIPGATHRKRYEDVLDIIAAGSDVLATLNIQHLESIAPTVGAITGIKVRETVPDWIVQTAEEAVMVDLTPEALQNRMKRGDIYKPEKVDQALTNFFRRGNLIALRELALRQIADQVDKTLESYMEQKDIQDNWAVRERIAVGMSAHPRAQYLIARAARMARRIDAELYAVYVDLGNKVSPEEQKTLEANVQFAESLGAIVARLKSKSIADAMAAFSREKHITQVIFGRSALEGWKKWIYLAAMNRFLRGAPAVDIHIVQQEPD